MLTDPIKGMGPRLAQLAVGTLFSEPRQVVELERDGGKLDLAGMTVTVDHTPGHTAFAIHSAGQSLLAMSDTVRNPYLFARHPDWQPLFDMDGPQAVSARRKMLDQAAADRMPVEAYHFPFPACGHVGRTATGYDFVPTEWSPL